MPGIIGFYPFGEGRENWNACRFLYYGLNALQHRGQESTGLSSLGKDRLLSTINDDVMVEDFFKEKAGSLKEGHIAIGQTSPIKGDGVIYVKEPVELVCVGDGKPDLHPDKVTAFKIFSEKLSQMIYKCGDTLEATKSIIREVHGGYSFIVLTKNEEMICGRDIHGVKPLEIGAIGFDIGIVASETAALDVMGAEHTGSVNPGEVVIFDPLSIRRERCGEPNRKYCSFEYIYLARLDSYLNGISVSKVRENIGRALARERPIQANVVIGIPETALAFAMAYSEEARIPTRIGFVRTGRYTRSAIRPTQLERLTGVQLKLNPVRYSVDNKDVILIDDSVVRGNTLKSTVLDLKRKGAKRVHVKIGSPALVAPCPYGTEVPPRDELIGGNLSEEEISYVIGADSFSFLPISKLVECIGLKESELCMKCFGVDWEVK
ncbi:MAG: amidophosphoribosyltransferase [Nitrososphaerota archaeon]|nr:amidophosphoribosyltransferase [Nitrososphaerota archaeon]